MDEQGGRFVEDTARRIWQVGYGVQAFCPLEAEWSVGADVPALNLTQEPDMENLLIDSTIARAHPYAAGASAERGGRR